MPSLYCIDSLQNEQFCLPHLHILHSSPLRRARVNERGTWVSWWLFSQGCVSSETHWGARPLMEGRPTWLSSVRLVANYVVYARQHIIIIRVLSEVLVILSQVGYYCTRLTLTMLLAPGVFNKIRYVGGVRRSPTQALTRVTCDQQSHTQVLTWVHDLWSIRWKVGWRRQLSSDSPTTATGMFNNVINLNFLIKFKN